MRLFIFLLILTINFQYFAYSQTSNIEYNISKPPLCSNNNGEKVYFKNLKSKTGKIIDK